MQNVSLNYRAFIYSMSVAALLSVNLIGSPNHAFAEEQVSHYKPIPSNNLTEAVANFTDYNGKLAAVLSKTDLSLDEMENIHQITYTLEEALVVMRSELKKLADTLEALHLSSEEHSPTATRKHGTVYLKSASTLMP